MNQITRQSQRMMTVDWGAARAMVGQLLADACPVREDWCHQAANFARHICQVYPFRWEAPLVGYFTAAGAAQALAMLRLEQAGTLLAPPSPLDGDGRTRPLPEWRAEVSAYARRLEEAVADACRDLDLAEVGHVYLYRRADHVRRREDGRRAAEEMLAVGGARMALGRAPW